MVSLMTCWALTPITQRPTTNSSNSQTWRSVHGAAGSCSKPCYVPHHRSGRLSITLSTCSHHAALFDPRPLTMTLHLRVHCRAVPHQLNSWWRTALCSHQHEHVTDGMFLLSFSFPLQLQTITNRKVKAIDVG